MGNHYNTLGVDSDASQEDIRAAYRRKAKEVHPDQAADEDCGPFRDLHEAYTVLSDPDRRRAYDRQLKRPRAAPRREAEPVRSPGRFGGIFDFLGRQAPPPVDLEIRLTPERARQGGQIQILLSLPVACPVCGGRGDSGFYRCQQCAGRGTVAEERPVRLDLPPGIPHNHRTEIYLEEMGLSLTVRFIVA